MPRKKQRKVILQLDTKSYEGFKISFDIRKTLDGEPHTANIKIHNLSWETVGDILADYRALRVRLLAGYEGAPPPLLFEGNVIAGGLKVVKQGTERIVDIEAQTGIRAYQSARVNVSFEKGTTYQQILQEVARQMGYPSTVITEDPRFDKKIQSGICLSGKASRILDQLAETLDQKWTIQDGSTLQFIGRNKTLPERGPRFSPQLGNIVNSPEPTDIGIQLTTLMEPLKPGDRFVVDRIESSKLAGNYRVDSIQFTGDSGYDNSFYSIIEGRRVPV